MKAFELEFEEQVLSIYQPDSKPKLLEHSPSGRVPVLIDDDVTVWDSLAITEYLAEVYPEHGIWQREAKARAHARAISAEMHAEFRALRAECPMNLGKRLAAKDRGEAVGRDVTRITKILKTARARFGAEGPYLFGALSAAEAPFTCRSSQGSRPTRLPSTLTFLAPSRFAGLAIGSARAEPSLLAGQDGRYL